jgi:hypothetical protein
MWAQNQYDSRFVGGRCNVKKPKTDENGRIIEQDCFDTNPGTWHMAVVNQIGIAKRGFIIDATYDAEVWNQPVYKYSYTYFNPQTGKPVNTLDEAKVEMKDFTSDKFKKYRSKEAARVVGISMKLIYIAETGPSHAETNSAEHDRQVQVTYNYDVELSADNKIIGGEWYQNAHPDFMWGPTPTAKINDYGLAANESWNGSDSLPDEWKQAATEMSQAMGAPFVKVMDALVAKAAK